MKRKYSVGAEVQPTGVHFRLWAPSAKRVELVIGAGPGKTIPLEPDGEGYLDVFVENVGAGAQYGFRIDGDQKLIPDPASRYQPQGPHEYSEVIDPARFSWTDGQWEGLAEDTAKIIYELHIGTLTGEGTWKSAAEKLSWFRSMGINMLEIMPIAEFPGEFGWGYDGVDLWAPSHLYGKPDDFRAFVDRAHAEGIAVILDVVYNHLGPDGNYLRLFSNAYFTDRYPNDWGDSINFDGEGSAGTREFFTDNAGYWIHEFHLDGLRLDATQSIIDLSGDHILAAITKRARAAAGSRRIFIVAENEPQEAKLFEPLSDGGYDIDAMWNDDFHHSAIVALTGRHEAYYTDYFGRPQEFISAAKHGFLFQGQWYRWQKASRGTISLGFPGPNFVWFLENHDQVANTFDGARLSIRTSPAMLRAMTGLLFLGPALPMLFQGQEFGSTRKFLYFAHHGGDLGAAIQKGRHSFLEQFDSLATREVQAALPDALSEDTFRRSQLDWSEAESHQEAVTLHRDLISLRQKLWRSGTLQAQVDGAVLSEYSFLLRYLTENGEDRLLIVNLGSDLSLSPAPEPLIAPPRGKEWAVEWSSESTAYGGGGSPRFRPDATWTIPARTSVLYTPIEKRIAGGKDGED
ncbi:MAG TPA: malto-oligosyltrehalose trehalohydrolase [Thermoanaerobaculia bacterium]|nr:malto-oligosyltrehalose trehalohydrolase [Thermoanaerobaculia bacterium]